MYAKDVISLDCVRISTLERSGTIIILLIQIWLMERYGPQIWLMDKPDAPWRRTFLSEKLGVFRLEVCECRKTEACLLEFDGVWIERIERAISDNRSFLFGASLCQPLANNQAQGTGWNVLPHQMHSEPKRKQLLVQKKTFERCLFFLSMLSLYILIVAEVLSHFCSLPQHMLNTLLTNVISKQKQLNWAKNWVSNMISRMVCSTVYTRSSSPNPAEGVNASLWAEHVHPNPSMILATLSQCTELSNHILQRRHR